MANENFLNVLLSEILINAGIEAYPLLNHGKSQTDNGRRMPDR